MNQRNTHLEAARALIPVLEARALQAEAERQLPAATVEDLLAAGLPRMLQPAAYGGGATSVAAYMDVCAMLARGCVSSAWCNFVWGIHNFLISRYPEQVQDEAWGTNPAMLTSASIGPVGRATLGKDGITISGRWGFNSGCDHAGALLLGASSEGGSWLCLVPSSDYIIVDNWHVAGLKGTGSKDVEATDLFVPRERALPFSTGVDPNRALLTLVIAGPILGAAQAALERYRALLCKVPDAASRQRFADVSARVHAARLVVEHACGEIDAALGSGSVLPPSTQLRIARDTTFAARLCRETANDIFAAVSGRSLHDTDPLQRIWRDVAAGCSHARMRWDAAAEAFAIDALGAPG